MSRAVILVLDSFGIGSSKDAVAFGDVGANTLGHIAEQCYLGLADEERSGPLKLPNLSQLGLMHAAKLSVGEFPRGCVVDSDPVAAYGYAEELSSGKDTSSGHWEMTGVPVLFDWGYFTAKEDSFPASLLESFIEKAGLPGVLCRGHASGTEVIERLGDEHMRTGKPIVYTSADSVFQIACHEETFGLERLQEISEIAFSLVSDFNICRVISRPFVGDKSSGFVRTGNRRDLSVLPPAATLLDKLCESEGEVIAIGKISDIFAGQGVTRKVKASGLDSLFDATLEAIEAANDRSLVFTNFVDFDSEYGHRRDVAGYARALEWFDLRLPEMLQVLDEDDLLVITADHGCDPTWQGCDHTREHIPVLAYGGTVKPGSIGCRQTFADIGQSISSHLEIARLDYGTSFLTS
jgi:phosphopentomutase